MSEYENLLEIGYKEGLDIREKPLKSNSKALCKNRKIAINTKLLVTTTQRRCFLNEEIWHNRVTVGNITDLRDIRNLKQECFARGKSFQELVSPDKIVKALLDYCTDLRDICDYLNITEECFCEALEYYKKKYGLYYRCNDYTLYFEPLSVVGSYTT